MLHAVWTQHHLYNEGRIAGLDINIQVGKLPYKMLLWLCCRDLLLISSTHTMFHKVFTL